MAGDATTVADRLEAAADTVGTRVNVPCGVVVARGEPVSTTLGAASNGTPVVTLYRGEHGPLSPFGHGIFDSRYGVVAFRRRFADAGGTWSS